MCQPNIPGMDSKTTPAPLETASDIIDFWREAGPDRWFAKDAEFDARFKAHCLPLYEAAVRGDLASWQSEPDGALALVLLLDQFPRNCFRDTAGMFATDAQARTVADEAIEAGHDRAVDADLRVFFYLPFEHSEELADQDRSVALAAPLDALYLSYAELHREIIVRFGRFPHRNVILGRSSTPDEQRYLDEGGFGG
jgi:uncharacterized protein (DUF924 family)